MSGDEEHDGLDRRIEPMDSRAYQWQERSPGGKLEPGGWVLNRRLSSCLSGELWLATKTASGDSSEVYFPPQSLVENELLFDEFCRRTQTLVGTLPERFQSIEALVTESVPWPWVRIEWVDGLDLNQFRLSLSNRLIPIAQIHGWLEPVVSAFEEGHQRRLFHRSLDPASFRLDREGAIRVLHCGWRALFAELEQRSLGGTQSALPPTYLSPQQLDGRTPEAADDVYGFAASLYEFVSNQPPFMSGDVGHQIRRVAPEPVRKRIESLGEDPERVSLALDQALSIGLEKLPEDRFESVRALWREAWDDSPVKSVSESLAKASRVRPVAKIRVPEVGGMDGEAGEDLDLDDVGTLPYYPPPPETNDKRFGVVFVGLVILMILGGVFLKDYYFFPETPPLESMAEGSSDLAPSIPTNVSTSAEFAALSEVPGNHGWLSVRTEPPSAIAELWVNSQEVPVERVTPAVFSHVPAGPVELRLIATGYAETNLTTIVTAGRTNRVSASLAFELGRVDLKSVPRGVLFAIRKGGREVRSGMCPDAFDLQVGLYQLDYTLGWRTNRSYLRVKPGESTHHQVVFEAGKMSVESEPDDVEILVAGRSMGFAPLTVTNLPPGTHRVVLRSPRFRSAVLEVEIAKDVDTFVTRSLDPLPEAVPDEEWVNSLGMRFLPIGSQQVLFGEFEVTEEIYGQFLRDRSGEAETVAQSGVPDGNGDRSDRVSGLPVANANWDDAVAFCAWLTARERREGFLGEGQVYRLPSGEEWDRAVGLPEGETGSRLVFPWGAWPPRRNVGNYALLRYQVDDQERETNDPYEERAPVGQFPANRFGLFDLGGNVREWCQGGVGGSSGDPVVRGGSWRESDPGRIASGFREFLPRATRSEDVGFRVVLGLRSSR